MTGSETASAKFFARVKSSDADVPRTIPASASVLKSVAGSCRAMLCLKDGWVWEKQEKWEGQATGPTTGFSRQRQTRSYAYEILLAGWSREVRDAGRLECWRTNITAST